MGSKMNYDRARIERAIRRHGIEFNDLPGNYREWGKEGKELRQRVKPIARNSPTGAVSREQKKSRFAAPSPARASPDRATLAANIRNLISIYEAEIIERKSQIERLRGHLNRLTR